MRNNLNSKCLAHAPLYLMVQFINYFPADESNYFCTGFEEDSTGKLVRCLICFEGNPHGKLGGWIARTSMKNHVNSAGHATQVLQKAEWDVQKAEDETQRQRLNQGPSARLPSIFMHHAPSTSRRAGMFDNVPSLVDLDDISAPNPQTPLHNPEFITPVGVTLLSDNAAEKRRQMEEQYQELLRQAEHIDEFGEDEDSFNFEHGGREGMERLVHLSLTKFLTQFVV